MSDVSVIGLGAMGSAIARAEISAGHAVTVWNRSPEKIEPLAKLGASAAASFLEAVRSSPASIICVDNYSVADPLLKAEEVASQLNGKTFIQVSTGTPGEARSWEAWLGSHGAGYLDGSIMCYPDKVGDSDSLFLLGGKQAVYEANRKLLEALGGDLRYLGENVAAAATIDLALLASSVSLYVGVAHGAQICQAEGVDVSHLASTLYHGDKSREMAEIIHAGAYELSSLYDGASMNVYKGIVDRLLSHARESATNIEIPEFLSRIYQKGVDAGYGEEDRAALVKVL